MPQYETISDYWDTIRARMDRREREAPVEAPVEAPEVVPGRPLYWSTLTQPVEIPDFADTVEDIINLMSILMHLNPWEYLVSLETPKYSFGYPLPIREWEDGRLKKKRWWDREREADPKQLYLPFYKPMELIRIRRRHRNYWEIYTKHPKKDKKLDFYIDAYCGFDDDNPFSIKAIKFHHRDSLPSLKTAQKSFEDVSKAFRDAAGQVQGFTKAELFYNFYSGSSNNTFTWTTS